MTAEEECKTDFLSCTLCKIPPTNITEFNNHQNKKNHCKMCHVFGFDQDVIIKHNKEHKYLCGPCQKTAGFAKIRKNKYDVVENLLLHTFEYHSQYCCKDCLIVFKKRRYLKQHKNKQHKTFTCLVNRCNMNIIGCDNYSTHKNEMHVSFKCKVKFCNMNIKGKGNFTQHGYTQHSLLSCSFCKKNL